MNSKIKPLPLLAGAIALSLSIASALPAFSQSTNPTAPTQRNQMRRPNFLNLTAQQQAQMEQIRQNKRSQIDAILTAEQKAQLQRARENRGNSRAGERRGMPHPLASLNLTAEQRSRIEAVMRSSREQMDAILTPEQRQQMQQHKQQHQQRRQASPQATRNR
jgi:Spy/CpxP family protein refolding chaperone